MKKLTLLTKFLVIFIIGLWFLSPINTSPAHAATRCSDKNPPINVSVSPNPVISSNNATVTITVTNPPSEYVNNTDYYFTFDAIGNFLDYRTQFQPLNSGTTTYSFTLNNTSSADGWLHLRVNNRYAPLPDTSICAAEKLVVYQNGTLPPAPSSNNSCTTPTLPPQITCTISGDCSAGTCTLLEQGNVTTDSKSRCENELGGCYETISCPTTNTYECYSLSSSGSGTTTPSTYTDPCAPDGVSTGLGCIPTNPTNLVKWILKYAILAGGGIAFLLSLFGGLTILLGAGNPEKINEGKQIISSAIAGLLFIIFSIFLLRFIGVDILQLPGFKK